MKKPRPVNLTPDEIERLEALTHRRVVSAGQVQRAKILLLRSKGIDPDAICKKLDIGRATVFNTLKKYFKAGVDSALAEEERSGRPSICTDDIKTIIINLSCVNPHELGYAQELWTVKKLTEHINSKKFQDEYPGVGKISKSSIERILQAANIKPYKIKYYCERRDPEFEQKMQELLVIYKTVQLQLDGQGQIIGGDIAKLTTLSYDEKPGIQALSRTSPDLMPIKENGCIMRDHEYKRLGTVSLLAAIDLLSGKATALVSDSHKSCDYIEFLKKLDETYPKEQTLRIILDNHSIHKSKETNSYLQTVRDGRFMFVYTPKHGSWLNLIESFFGKMTRQMLRGIRVSSKDELVERIYKYFDEINESPVIFRWKYKLEEVSVG